MPFEDEGHWQEYRPNTASDYRVPHVSGSYGTPGSSRMTGAPNPSEAGRFGSAAAEHAPLGALAACLFALCGLHAWHGHWIGDFWEHSAVVRELATHPIGPRHPLLRIDAPHAFANPYALIVATFCRLAGVSSVTGLAAAALVNLAMLIVALRVFVGRVAPERAGTTSFFTLLFMLFLWGRKPWDFSGFYHISAVIHTLAYPSAFAFWVALLLLAIQAKRVERGGLRRLLVAVPLGSVVLLSHPITFLFVATGMAALALNSRRPLLEAAISSMSVLVSGLLALAWPYFPLWALLTGGAAAYDASNVVMYSRVLVRTFPASIGLPLLVAEWRRTSRKSAVVWVGLLIAIYAFGHLTGRYSYGRVIFFIVFLLQLEIAKSVARLRADIDAHGFLLRARIPEASVVIVCVLLSAPALIGALRDTVRYERTDAGYHFLNHEVPQYDVMMAEAQTGWIASSFGGKLVASPQPLAFVSDFEQRERRSAVTAFFRATTPSTERLRLLGKYGASYVLVARSSSVDPTAAPESVLRALGTVTYEDGRFVLVRAAPSPSATDASSAPRSTANP